MNYHKPHRVHEQIRVEYQGRQLPFKALSSLVGIPYQTLWWRFHRKGLRGSLLVAPVMRCKSRSQTTTTGD